MRHNNYQVALQQPIPIGSEFNAAINEPIKEIDPNEKIVLTNNH